MSLKDVDIPDDKDPEDYSYMERRAELFSFVLEAGHPDLLNQTKFAERYGVVQSTISKDLKRIREDVKDELGTDAEFIAHAVFHKALRELARQGEWVEATRIIERWFDWLFDSEGSGIRRAPDRHDVRADIAGAASQQETHYQVVIGDGATVEGILERYEESEAGFTATPNSGVEGMEDAVDVEIEDDSDLLMVEADE